MSVVVRTERVAMRINDAIKRASDIGIAGFLLLILLPLTGLCCLFIYLEDGRPIFFRQARVGRNGAVFSLLKLRSMRMHRHDPTRVGQVRSDHELVTRTGRIIRRLKLDELPQLLNVIRGDMALVGPRPALPQHAAEYSPVERRRLAVRPGMTGWAQVNGGIELSWPERIALDVWYVHNRSLVLDLRILLQTMVVILVGERRNENALSRALRDADDCGRRRS